MAATNVEMSGHDWIYRLFREKPIKPQANWSDFENAPVPLYAILGVLIAMVALVIGGIVVHFLGW